VSSRSSWFGTRRRDAQPFNREDVPRQVGSRLSSQTLGVTKGMSAVEASSMCDLAFRLSVSSLGSPHLHASRAEQVAAQNQALGSRIPQALGAFVVRSACCGSRPLRRRSGRVSQSAGRRFQGLVGASRRLNSQQLSAAVEGSAMPARVARPKKYCAKESTESSRPAGQWPCQA
jgi:hypothetical protein